MLKSKLRKVTVILTIIMLMTLTLGLVTACGGNPSDSTTSYKVTFYDGTTVITTETVKEGKKIENFVPADKGYSKEGYAFNGWFATSDFTHDWSFDTAITKDTNVRNGSQVNKIPANGQLRAALQPAALWRRSDGMAARLRGKTFLQKQKGKTSSKLH